MVAVGAEEERRIDEGTSTDAGGVTTQDSAIEKGAGVSFRFMETGASFNGRGVGLIMTAGGSTTTTGDEGEQREDFASQFRGEGYGEGTRSCAGGKPRVVMEGGCLSVSED